MKVECRAEATLAVFLFLCTSTVLARLPMITTQPANQAVVEGKTATFSVAARGRLPLLYHWSFDGANIDTATNSSLTLTNVQLAQSGSYSVTVATAMGSTLSSNAALTVFKAPTVLFFDDFNGPDLNPIWQTNLPNAFDGEFPANPTPAPYIGAPTFSFELLDSNTVLNMNSVIGPEQRVGWSSSTNFQADSFRYEARFNTEFFSPTTSVDGILEIWIMNATNSNLYDLVSPFAGGGYFLYMFFSSSVDDNYFNRNAYAFAENTWYRLVLQALPGQNIRASLCDDNENELMGFTFNHGASAFGSGFKIVIAQSDGTDVLQPFPTDAAVDYVRLTTGFAPTIVAQPQSQNAIEGANVTFTVASAGTPPQGYQWNFDGAPITGATNSTLTLTDLQTSNAGNYSVIVTNIYGIGISSNATLAVGLSPTITRQPANETAAEGLTVVFDVTAGGTAPLSYQWNFDGTSIVDATNATLTLTNVQFSESGNYAVLVTNIFGSAKSSSASLTVLAPPAIVSEPKSLTVAVGGTATFTVTATGTLPLNYFWSFNGGNISKATNSTLTLTNVALSQAGNYSVFISNAYGSTNSSNATLTVLVLPSLSIVSSSGTFSISWPTNAVGFVLMTTTNLESGNWVPVATSPVQSGNQYIESIVPSGTAAFYRLEYTGN